MFKRFACLVRREHDYRLRGRNGRVFLECKRCGVQSPGWEMGPSARPVRDTPPPLRLLLDESILPRLMPDARLPAVTGRPSRLQPASSELRLFLDS